MPLVPVEWDGFVNARDLGGLRTRDGGTTRYGAYVRSASVREVTAAGWQAAREHGIRTIVDLRNDDEIRPASGVGATTLAGTAALPPVPADGATPPGLTRVEVAIDAIEDVEFWRDINDRGLNGTPLYYRPFLERHPQRVAAVVTALAQAETGVIFHCGGGRDRTGLVALILLTLADVEPEQIADDYDVTLTELPPFLARVGEPDHASAAVEVLAAHGHTARTALLQVLDGLDVERYLLDAGVSAADVTTIRDRLVG